MFVIYVYGKRISFISVDAGGVFFSSSVLGSVIPDIFPTKFTHTRTLRCSNAVIKACFNFLVDGLFNLVVLVSHTVFHDQNRVRFIE